MFLLWNFDSFSLKTTFPTENDLALLRGCQTNLFTNTLSYLLIIYGTILFVLFDDSDELDYQSIKHLTCQLVT